MVYIYKMVPQNLETFIKFLKIAVNAGLGKIPSHHQGSKTAVGFKGNFWKNHTAYMRFSSSLAHSIQQLVREIN